MRRCSQATPVVRFNGWIKCARLDAVTTFMPVFARLLEIAIASKPGSYGVK